jgi:CubicO group peptidase (beta-lactamase class C family)
MKSTLATCLTAFTLVAWGASSAPSVSIDELLQGVREQSRVPALAAAVVWSNHIVAFGAVGIRKSGATNAVTPRDKFHIGSCTKSMTATLAAMLVEQGDFSWNTTIGSGFPAWSAELHSDYAGVTLEQLLSHTAGVPGDLVKAGVWTHVWARSGEAPEQQRLDLARELLTRAPEVKPGDKFIYANAGYTIAGVMIERRERRAWEDLLRERLFKPLGMDSAGYGAPGDARQIDQPWGHALKDGRPVPEPPGAKADNPAAIGPGGTVHCSIIDFARYANLHLQGERGASRLLRAETFRKLHAPMPGRDYALGWHVTSRPWAKGRTLTHNGTNTRNFAVMWLAPEIEFGVVVACNLGGKTAEKACDTTASRLIGKFLK